jgi:hypothetical protein
MKTHTKWTLLASLLLLAAIQAVTAEDAPKKEATKPEAPKKAPGAYALLGVAVSSSHPALANNLGDLLSPEQGLIVEELGADSPAAKAGIKLHDILTSYDDQKLFSAEQLAKLVQADRAGREVTVGYLRDGKLHKAQLKLGETELPQVQWRTRSAERGPGWYGGPRRMMRRQHARAASGSEWDNFDSLTLKKVGENKLRAEVHYLDKEGKTQKHVFEGTREEIRKAIEAEKDLKPVERAHLLRSLNLPSIEDDLLLIPGWLHDLTDDGF